MDKDTNETVKIWPVRDVPKDTVLRIKVFATKNGLKMSDALTVLIDIAEEVDKN